MPPWLNGFICAFHPAARVWVQRTPSMLLSMWFLSYRKDKNKQKEADFGPLKATTMIEELCVSAYFYQQSWVIIGRHVSTPLVRFQLLTTGSVTEWPDYGFNIWPFSAMKICPKAYKLYQSELKTLPKTK